MRRFHAQWKHISGHNSPAVSISKSDKRAFKSCMQLTKTAEWIDPSCNVFLGDSVKGGLVTLEDIACKFKSEPSVFKKQHCCCFLPWLRSGCRTGRLAGAQSRAWCCRKDNGRDAGIEGCLLPHANGGAAFFCPSLNSVTGLSVWCQMTSSPW